MAYKSKFFQSYEKEAQQSKNSAAASDYKSKFFKQYEEEKTNNDRGYKSKFFRSQTFDEDYTPEPMEASKDDSMSRVTPKAVQPSAARDRGVRQSYAARQTVEAAAQPVRQPMQLPENRLTGSRSWQTLTALPAVDQANLSAAVVGIEEQKLVEKQEKAKQVQQQERKLVAMAEQLRTAEKGISDLMLQYESDPSDTNAQAFQLAAGQYDALVKQYNEAAKQYDKDKSAYVDYNQQVVSYQKAYGKYQDAAYKATRERQLYLQEHPEVAYQDASSEEIKAAIAGLKQENSDLIAAEGPADWDAVRNNDRKIQLLQQMLLSKIGETQTETWGSGGMEFLDRTKAALDAGQYQWWAGMTELFDRGQAAAVGAVAGIVKNVAAVVGAEDLMKSAQKLQKEAKEYRSQSAEDMRNGATLAMLEALEGTGKVDGWIIKQMQSVGSMMMDIWAAGATQGWGTPEGMSTRQVLGLRATGSGILDAAEKGYEPTTQLAVGIANGALEYISEGMFGGNPIYDADKGWVVKLAEKAIKNPKITRLLYSSGFGLFEEGLEELFAGVTQPTAEYILSGGLARGEEFQFPDAEELADAFAGGMFLSLLGNAASVAVTEVSGQGSAMRRAQRSMGGAIQQAEAVQELVAEGLAADPRSDAYVMAKKLQKKLDAGKELTVSEIGKQLFANEAAINEGLLASEGEPVEADEQAGQEIMVPKGKLQDPEEGFFAVETINFGNEMTYRLVNVKPDGTIEPQSDAVNDILIAKLMAEARGMAVLFINNGTELRKTAQAIFNENKSFNYTDAVSEDISDGWEKWNYIRGKQEKLAQLRERLTEKKDRNAGTAENVTAEGLTEETNTDMMNAEAEQDAFAEPGLQWAGNETEGEQEYEQRTEQQGYQQGYQRQRQGDLGGSGNTIRNSGNDTGRSEGSQKSKRTSDAIRRAEEASDIRDYAEAQRLRLKSSKEIGIPEGTDEKNLRVLDRNASEAVRRAFETAENAGLRLVPVSGPIYVTENGEVFTVNGAHNSGTVYAQADSVRMSIGEIVSHEIFHSRVRKDEGLVKRLKKWILDNYSEDVLNEKLERYYKSYQTAYSGRGTDEKLEEMILEEMLADAYAEYRRYGQEILPGLSERAQEEAWANEGAAAGETGTRFSISSTLETDLKKVLDGTFKARNNEVYIGETSNFLTDVIGADALRVTMPPTKAYSAMVTEEQARADGRYVKHTNYHGLGIDGLMKVLEASENPVAAFADTGNEKSKRSGNLVLVTNEMGPDGNIVVVEAVNAAGYLQGKQIEANKVITSYDRYTIANDILQAAIDGRLLHLDKKRSQTILAGMPAANSQITIQESDFNKNIQNFWANVKWAKEGKAQYLSESSGEEKTAFAQAYEEAQRKRDGAMEENGLPVRSQFSLAEHAKEQIFAEEEYRGDESPATGDIRFSIAENENITARSEKYFEAHRDQSGHISEEMFRAANDVVREMAEYMRPYLDVSNNRGKRYLPEEILGNTQFKNGSYGKTIENTTICWRTLSYIDFTNEIKKKIGRPLTVEESFLASQMLYDIAKEPQCLYCYVSLDRKAYDGFLLEYTRQRDEVMEQYRASDIPPEERLRPQAKRKADRKKAQYQLGDTELENIYRSYLAGREDTPNQRARFNLWLDAYNEGQLITNGELTTEEIRSEVKNRDGMKALQIQDAEEYAQSASWAKKLEQYRSYNSDILNMSSNLVQKLNKHYGLRFYSFSEYTPAFIVENMQQIRDASLKGLYGLAYTKKPDFARIFASTGMNINISVFGRMDNGVVVPDTLQGADWAEVQQLRQQHKNVGAVFVATNDEMTEWALAQDWIDVVIPFHIVRTGANVAEFYKWVNNTKDQADVDEKGKNRTISPAEFHNDFDTYMGLIEKRGLTPRFARFLDNPNYMKLVNETRLSDRESSRLHPVFDLEAAKASFDTFVEEGGYYGDWYEEGVDYEEAVDTVAQDVLSGKRANEVEYGRQDVDASVAMRRRRNRLNRSHGQSLEGSRFSMAEPVEETGTLLALHNMDEEKIRRTLELGAWPAPSIAIVQAKHGHTNYGEYSAIFPRSVIDPELDERNKVYGSDAWTPTHSNATVEWEVNQREKRDFERTIEELSSTVAGGAFNSGGALGRAGVNDSTSKSARDIAEQISNYPDVMAAYLAMQNGDVEVKYREKDYHKFGNNALRRYIASMSTQELAALDVAVELRDRETVDAEAQHLRKVLEEVFREEISQRRGKDGEPIPERLVEVILNRRMNSVEGYQIESFIQSAWQMLQDGNETGEIDKYAMVKELESKVDKRDVAAWAEELLGNVLGESGIYNGVDIYTENGRRSFKETHMPLTAENIVKAMFETASRRGEGAYGMAAGGLQSVASPTYHSVEEIRADSHRLGRVSEEELAARKEEIDERLSDLYEELNELPGANVYNIPEAVINAAGERHIEDVIRSFETDGIRRMSGDTALRLIEVFEMAAQLPTEYFEAKPERVVRFEDALAVLAPDNTPTELLNEMRDAGMNVVEYEAGNDAQRLEIANSLEGSRFSTEDEIRERFHKDEMERRLPGLTEEELRVLNEAEMRKRERKEWKEPQTAEEILIPKEAFTSTKAMDKLGIKIDGSVTRYRETKVLIEMDKAMRQAQRMINKKIRELRATEQEIALADMLIKGSITPDMLNQDTVDMDTVLEIADYLGAARSFGDDRLSQRRDEINTYGIRMAKELFADSEDSQPKLKGALKAFTKLVMNERTPERVVKQIFGQERGKKIYEAYFRPVWVNGAEMYRFENRMKERVAKFRDASGKSRALTEEERAMAQRMVEGEAVRERMDGLLQSDPDMWKRISDAAANINNGESYVEQVREFNIPEELQGVVQAYADYMDMVSVSDKMDRTILQNAVETYKQIYNEMYDAINDFLVSHGYRPIGFIKGYAPHFQKQEVQQGLFGALKALGVEKESVSELPVSIAGRTADFKPNMRWNPHAQQRKGTKTDYDIQAGFERYLHYAAEMFYHTDDIMKIRQAVNWMRSHYSSEDISWELEAAQVDQFKDPEWKRQFLIRKELIPAQRIMDTREINEAYRAYVDELFDRAKPEQLRKYSEFVTWLDNYANIVAGKQSLADRGIEYGGGRNALNWGSRLMRTFAASNVAGNLSSAINQTAQLPLIQQQLGKYMELAMWDMVRGAPAKESFYERSDFLTDKRGVEKLSQDRQEKFISTLFKPAELADRMVSTLAVRGRYLQALDQGMTPERALREADDFGRRVMGSRMRGARPLGFESKTFINQMLHIFQTEASNTFDYMLLSDMPQAVREVYRTKGKFAAARNVAATVTGYLINAFLLNRLTDELYGGSPAPFDLIGWLLNFVAGGWGMDDEDYLKTIIDNGWERLFGERPFETEQIDREKGFDWAGSMDDLGYNVLNDVPYVRNAAGVLGLGDQSLPTVGINEFAKNIGSAGKTLFDQATKGQEETGLSWAGAAGDAAEDVIAAATQILPGGRQIKKTLEGAAALGREGRYRGWGDNRRLLYPVEGSAANWARGLMFGPSALEETDAYYAGGKALTAGQTLKVLGLEEKGVSIEQGYGLYQDLSEINQAANDERLSSQEAKRAKRELINEMDLSDQQKLEVYMDVLASGNEKAKRNARSKYQALLNAGVSWEQITELDNAYAEIETDADGDGTADMSALERGIAKRNFISSLNLNDEQKLEVYDRYHLDRTSKNYEENRQEFQDMLDSGLTWDQITQAHNTYAELNADEEMKATEKATAYSKWIDEQGWDSSQKAAAKERFQFWQMMPAEATTYEKFTDAGVSIESSDELTKILKELEPLPGKQSVTTSQRILAIDKSGVSQQEKTAAIAALSKERFDKFTEAGLPESAAEKLTAKIAVAEAKNGDADLKQLEKARMAIDVTSNDREAMTALSAIVGKDTYARIKLMEEYGVTARNWVEYKEAWKEYYGDDSVSQEKLEEILDEMPISNQQAAAIWQAANKSWKPKNNPYDQSVAQEIYDALN